MRSRDNGPVGLLTLVVCCVLWLAGCQTAKNYPTLQDDDFRAVIRADRERFQTMQTYPTAQNGAIGSWPVPRHGRLGDYR